MSREKQIEEMTKVIASVPPITFPVGDMRQGRLIYAINKIAEAIYDAGICEPEWISVEERLPTKDENDRGIVGIVTGFNGKIRFKDAIILVDYDFDEKEWWSQDYDLTDCKVTHWMPLPEAPKGGAE